MGILTQYLHDKAQRHQHNLDLDREAKAGELEQAMGGLRDNLKMMPPTLDDGSPNPERQRVESDLRQTLSQYQGLWDHPVETPNMIQRFFSRVVGHKQPDQTSAIGATPATSLAVPSGALTSSLPQPAPNADLRALTDDISWIKKNVPQAEQADQILAATHKHLGAPTKNTVIHGIPGKSLLNDRDAQGNPVKDVSGDPIDANLNYLKDPMGNYYPQATKAAPAVKPSKPLKPTFHPTTGGLTTIEDANTGDVYHAGNIKQAPANVQAEWNAIQDQQATETKAKNDAEIEKETRLQSLRDAATTERERFTQDMGEYRGALQENEQSRKTLAESDRLRRLGLKAAQASDAVSDAELVYGAIHGPLGRVNEVEIQRIFGAGGLGDRFDAWAEKLATGKLPDAIRNRIINFLQQDYEARKQITDESDNRVKSLRPAKAAPTKAAPGDLKKRSNPAQPAQPSGDVTFVKDPNTGKLVPSTWLKTTQ